jgi:hypothetical protein
MTWKTEETMDRHPLSIGHHGKAKDIGPYYTRVKKKKKTNPRGATTREKSSKRKRAEEESGGIGTRGRFYMRPPPFGRALVGNASACVDRAIPPCVSRSAFLQARDSAKADIYLYIYSLGFG